LPPVRRRRGGSVRTRRGIASLCRSRGARRGEAVMACPVWARHGRASLGGSWKGAAVKAGLGMAEQVEACQREARRREVWPGRVTAVVATLARACRGEAAEASDGAATSGMAWRSNKGR